MTSEYDTTTRSNIITRQFGRVFHGPREAEITPQRRKSNEVEEIYDIQHNNFEAKGNLEIKGRKERNKQVDYRSR
jgi:hypothetical protein